jgi:hypothetical protein
MSYNEYHPWINEGITEGEYYKKRYLEARQDIKKLIDICEEAAQDLDNTCACTSPNAGNILRKKVEKIG